MKKRILVNDAVMSSNEEVAHRGAIRIQDGNDKKLEKNNANNPKPDEMAIARLNF